MTGTPTYSVVITAHNAAATIGATLGSVAKQAGIADSELEIVLVDDRSTDGTLDSARAAGVPNLRTIRMDQASASGLTTRQDALAAGFSAARGEIVLTTDADGVVAEDWVRVLAGPILSERADATAGPVLFKARRGMLGAWQTVDVSDYLATNRMLVALGFQGGVLFGNFAFRRGWFEKVGGFEKIGMTLTEDLAFGRALQAAGAKLVYVSGGPVEVAACESWRVLVERAKRVSAGGASALAVWLGIRMALLVVLAACALVFGGVFAWLFWVRYGLGAFFVGWALIRVRKPGLLPLAPLYEPLAIAIGVAVMWRLMRNAEIEWGGRKYAR
ncbi:MAG: glycosyltransferase [Rhizobiaceae bacterium]|nr:glycosyltransferase [Rhizobiaceae bacterium]